MRGFVLLVLSVAISMLVIPLAIRLAPRIGMVDQPDPRKVHKVPVPRVGGLGIAAGTMIPFFFLARVDAVALSFIVGCLVLLAFGVWDDARQISHWPKFLGQLAAVGVVVFWGDLYVTRLPFIEGAVLSPAVGKLFTMFAMVGVINAINHSDGLDGLAAGETLLSLTALAFLGYLTQSGFMTDVALGMIGGLLGFLRYNTHPARVFMGDAGSQVLGFGVAFLVVYLTQVANSAASAALPLLLLGLPIADILVVLYKRISGGMNWFKATRNHVHHRLLDLGFSHYHSVVTIYSFQALLVTAAVLLRYSSDLIVSSVYFGAIAMLFGLLIHAEHSGWRLERRDWLRSTALREQLNRLRRSAVIRTLYVWSIAAIVSALLLMAVSLSGEVPRDFGVTSAVTLLLIGAILAWRRGWRSAILRMAAYVTVVFATYLLTTYPIDTGLTERTGVIVMVLAAALAVFLRFVSDRPFGATPTDYLIAFALLALLAFSNLAGTGEREGLPLHFIAYSIVLFYGCEVIIGHLERWREVLGGASMATLLVVAARGLATGF
jgi:UDP-GlcNAc:undecaprenyl-phosphate/decaprenyl-phosphate GlcNAc-1-phosphate transferase